MKEKTEKQKALAEKFLALISEGAAPYSAQKTINGPAVESLKRWALAFYPDECRRLNIQPCPSLVAMNRKPPVRVKQKTHVLTLPIPEVDSKTKMALSLLDNCENTLRAVRQLLEAPNG